MFCKINKGSYNNLFLIVFIASAFGSSAQNVPEQLKIGERVERIVIDPGHGGKDHGCSGHGSIEKDIVLKIAKKLERKINSKYPEVEVILTRDKDEFIPLYKRAEIANTVQADLFISVHCNAINHSRTKGTETYVMGLHTEKENFEVAKRENASILLEEDYKQNYHGFDPNSSEGHIFLTMYQTAYREQSIRLAQLIEHAFGQSGRRSRGVKEAGFVVLRATAMPSVLVENGFLTHEEESHFLNSEIGMETMSQCVLNAISDYKEEVEISYSIEEKPIQALAVSANNRWSIQLYALQDKRPLEEMELPNKYPIVVLKENERYKYLYGSFGSRSEAEAAQIELKNLGYSSGFIRSWQ